MVQKQQRSITPTMSSSNHHRRLLHHNQNRDRGPRPDRPESYQSSNYFNSYSNQREIHSSVHRRNNDDYGYQGQQRQSNVCRPDEVRSFPPDRYPSNAVASAHETRRRRTPPHEDRVRRRSSHHNATGHGDRGSTTVATAASLSTRRSRWSSSSFNGGDHRHHSGTASLTEEEEAVARGTGKRCRLQCHTSTSTEERNESEPLDEFGRRLIRPPRNTGLKVSLSREIGSTTRLPSTEQVVSSTSIDDQLQQDVPVTTDDAPMNNVDIDDDGNDTPDGGEHGHDEQTIGTVAAVAEQGCPFFYNETDGKPMAFCCAKCRCSPEQRTLFTDAISVAEDENYYYHRHCCHKINEMGATPLQKVLDRINEQYEKEDFHGQYPAPKPKLNAISESTLKREYIRKLKNEQTKSENNDEDVDPAMLLETNAQYHENRKNFSKVAKERENDRRPAVVLDAFAGVGAALVVLKRLQIAMSKVIHVEHDKIATHVARHGHDYLYNPKLQDDGIEHVFLPKFEDIDGDVDQFLEDYGPIDIIIGGPPCTDYSAINANAQGPQGAQGQFLPRFADFIQNVQAKQPDHPVYYLIENVVFMDGLDNYNLIENITGVVETKQDALYFSPCRRLRSFWINFPLNVASRGFEESVPLRPSSCLQDGWQFPGEGVEEIVLCKVNTFMASKSRINDDRMVKVRPRPDGKYERAHFSVLERERMMGFPEGYVQGAVAHLFDELFHKALDVMPLPDESKPETLWKNRLDPKFFCFSGEPVKYEEAYNESEQIPYVRVLMSPPQVTATRNFFNAEDYSKHLLGNSFSIPVVEYLLKNLCDIFATRAYDVYSYPYRWETNNNEIADAATEGVMPDG